MKLGNIKVLMRLIAKIDHKHKKSKKVIVIRKSNVPMVHSFKGQLVRIHNGKDLVFRRINPKIERYNKVLPTGQFRFTRRSHQYKSK